MNTLAAKGPRREPRDATGRRDPPSRPRRLLLPSGRDIPLGDWPREIPCAGCGADLGGFTTVRLTPDFRRVCPACWVAERCGAGLPDRGAPREED